MDGAVRLKSFEFRRDRQARWSELEDLAARVERRGLRSLAPEELVRLPLLYRAALSSLSVARAISLDRALLDYLESLAARAYFCVYGTRRRLRDSIAAFFARRFPASVRSFARPVALATAIFLLGGVTAFAMTLRSSDWFYTFVSPDLAQGRDPAASTESLRAVLYHQESAADRLSTFTSFLFTHNARVGMFSFALGFAFGLPAFVLIFTNGTMLGAFAALYHGRGLGAEFWAWILPHGVPEIGAILLCGGGGLALAHALVFPGRNTRLVNLARRGREAAVLVLGAVSLFFLAALIEGIFRQTVMSVTARYGMVAAMTLLLAGYFVFVGRRAA